MNTFRKLMAVIACAGVLCAIGCSESPAIRPPTETFDVGPTYVAPDGTGPRIVEGIEHEYVATAEREAQIIGGFPKLKIGQSREDVRAALGLPDRARPMYGKKYNSPLLGWTYLYKIKMLAGSPNMKDVCVQVFFNPAGELHWAVPNHIPGLQEVGGLVRPIAR